LATDRLLLDVNALAITLVSDHPGHEYVGDALEPGFRGAATLLVFEYLPLRAHWVLTTQWGIDEESARDAVRSLLDQPLELVGAGRETLLDAYRLSTSKGHDVFDCFYLALARTHDADALLTTDRDFEGLCAGESVAYRNPVPAEVLSEFHRMNADSS
jgi:predicted nucleic acid-binding protein